jgi:hypothetical protein
VARQLRVDSPSSPNSRDQKLGSAVGVNGVVPVLRSDDLRFSAYYGNGIGRYSIGFFTDALLDANGHIVLPNEWLATVAYRHFWSPTLRSTLALSELCSSNPAEAAGSVNRNSQSAHLNVIWSPVAQTNFGLEYIHAGREVQSLALGTRSLVMSTAMWTSTH